MGGERWGQNLSFDFRSCDDRFAEKKVRGLGWMESEGVARSDTLANRKRGKV